EPWHPDCGCPNVLACAPGVSLAVRIISGRRIIEYGEVESHRGSLHVLQHHRRSDAVPDIAPLELRQGNAPEVDLIKNCLNLHGVSPKGSSSSPLLRSRLMNMRWPVARAWR